MSGVWRQQKWRLDDREKKLILENIDRLGTREVEHTKKLLSSCFIEEKKRKQNSLLWFEASNHFWFLPWWDFLMTYRNKEKLTNTQAKMTVTNKGFSLHADSFKPDSAALLVAIHEKTSSASWDWTQTLPSFLFNYFLKHENIFVFAKSTLKIFAGLKIEDCTEGGGGGPHYSVMK